MKKFLKVFIIVVLVVAVIALTSFFFFKKYKEKNNTTASFAVMLESNKTFNNNLKDVSSILEGQGDSRLSVVVESSKNLDGVVYELSTYHINKETKINDKNIALKVQQVNSSKDLLNKMIKEYNVKKESTYFNRIIGANDLYNQSRVYLIQYSELVKMLNNHLTIDKNVDVQFAVIELYADVIASTFNSTKVESGVHKIEDEENVKEMNKLFNDGKLNLSSNRYSVSANNFVNGYNQVNKLDFAKNLKHYLSLASDSSNDINYSTAYYFSQMVKKGVE